MSRFSDLVTKAAREMGSYTPQASQISPDALARLIKLDSNENPFGPSPLAIAAMQAASAATHSYPDDDCSLLRDKIAAQHRVSSEFVLVTAGSTEMLALLCQTLLGPGLNAVTSERSFIVYRMLVQATGATLIEAPMRDDCFDLDGILRAINCDTRLVFLANPNNPTGAMVQAATVDQFLRAIPEHVVVALDEAYYEFAERFAAGRRIEYSRSLDDVRRQANVVVLRTFSKVHGLAGLRIGYGMGPAELLGYCSRVRNAYSVSSIAQAAAVAAMDDHAHLELTLANNAEQADVLRDGLLELGYKVVPTSANFVYYDTGTDAIRVADCLLRDGISVRTLGAWGAPSCIRVSIGTPQQNRLFLDAMPRLP